MKNFITLIILLLAFQGKAQQTFCLEFTNPQVVSATEFQVTLTIKAFSAPFGLGSSNIRFNYNNNGLTLIPTATQPTTIVTNYLSAQYSTPTITKLGSAPNQYGSLNFTITNANTPLQVTTAGLDLVRIKFTITNNAQLSGLYWRILENNHVNQLPAPTGANTTLVQKLEMNTPTIILATESCITDLPNYSLAALPLELTSFDGETLPLSNMLYWETKTEKNVQTHLIERSADGAHWTEIGRKPGQANSNLPLKYTLEDRAPVTKAYYRLRSIDFDGQESKSNTILLTRKSDHFGITSVFPSPTVDNVTVQFTALQEETVTIQVLDGTGRLVLTQSVDAVQDINERLLPLNGLQAGIYTVTVTNSAGVSAPVRFVKQ